MAVNKGSIDDPTFTIMEWKPKNAKNKLKMLIKILEKAQKMNQEELSEEDDNGSDGDLHAQYDKVQLRVVLQTWEDP